MIERKDGTELLRQLYKMFDGDFSKLDLRPAETPQAIKQFLRTRPSLRKLLAALIAILGRINSTRRRAANR